MLCDLLVLFVLFRDWSLITGRGGLQNWRGGMQSFTPTKRGDGKGFSHAEGGGGHNKLYTTKVL